ncbi:hypothetical protein CC86DRAFT_62444 [Ophiobolus disseminans]|uniref:Uncharacterized protein n=1 Tax=Ophiobolus disseminans TaxID=1469910 RepID=A0A6A6ZT23_9PLEO|nr:hypothetical protein CC86DRAFT_62444 [Ophiobolus disseminans]
MSTPVFGRGPKREDVNYSAVETQEARESRTDDSVAGQRMVANWPSKPQHLKGVYIPVFIGDLLLVLFPIAFFVLAIAAYKLDQKPLSEYGRTVQRAMTLGPTIYPLLFAALCGRCLRSLAVWYAETGTTIEVLEKLLGSQNVVSAISTASSFRSANILSLFLLLLWALSPLGGQSSLRLLHETNRTISETSNVFYSDTSDAFALHKMRPSFSVVPSILSASLAASSAIRNGPVDLWSHPKVPRLDEIELEDAPATGSQGNWHEIRNNSGLTYSSWAGINLHGLRRSRKTSFQATYSYMAMDCTVRLRGGYDDVHNGLSAPNVTALPALKGGPSLLQETIEFQGKPLNLSTSFFLKYGFNGTRYPTSLVETYTTGDRFADYPAHLLYGSMDTVSETNDEGGNVLNVYQCIPQIITVEAGVLCNSDMCHVERLRRLPAQRGTSSSNRCSAEGSNNLLCMTAISITLDTFVVLFPTVTSFYTRLGQPNPFDDFMHSGSDTFNAATALRIRNWAKVPEKLISQRLTLILNTYWQAGSWGSQILSTEPFLSPADPNSPIANMRSAMQRTTAEVWHQIPVYRANLPWILALLFTTTVLLILGDIHLVMSWETIAPDIFNYVSSLTRENPHTDVPAKGTALAGVERSRLLRKLKVQIADVRVEDEIGYIALRSVVQKSEFSSAQLRKGRLYE